jgi:hypothetical protein
MDNRISTDWPCDVLERLLAKISELDRDLSANVVVGRRRNANATRRGNALKPRRDVDAIPEDVVPLDQDVPEVDPDPEQHAAVCRDTFVPLVHGSLHGHRAFDRIDH